MSLVSKCEYGGRNVSTTSSTLGTCPLCESPISTDQLLAVMGKRQPTTFAECTTCGDIVCPTDAVLPERFG